METVCEGILQQKKYFIFVKVICWYTVRETEGKGDKDREDK